MEPLAAAGVLQRPVVVLAVPSVQGVATLDMERCEARSGRAGLRAARGLAGDPIHPVQEHLELLVVAISRDAASAQGSRLVDGHLALRAFLGILALRGLVGRPALPEARIGLQAPAHALAALLAAGGACVVGFAAALLPQLGAL